MRVIWFPDCGFVYEDYGETYWCQHSSHLSSHPFNSDGSEEELI